MISLKNIKKSFILGDEKVNALDNISLEIQKGDFIAIIGPSGSGKSTLMNILGLLDVPDSGEYLFDGKEVNKLSDNELAEIRNKKIGFVFQNFNILPKMNAIENIQVPLFYRGMSDKESKQKAYEVLEKVGIKGREHHLPSQLSGGQQQRVAIARAIAGEPEIILADEPTGALDSKTSEEVMEQLKTLNENGQTIILITHDINVAKKAKKIMKILDGKLFLGTDSKNRKEEETND